MLTPYGKGEWSAILLIGGMLTATSIALQILSGGYWWVAAIVLVLIILALLSFFRDPHRDIPVQRGVMVSPCDGRVSSIHEVEHFEPFGEPATCVRVFLSVLDVHVNRSPCHGEVVWQEYKTGKFMNALDPKSAEYNENKTIMMVHPNRRYPVAAVRQIAGAIARRIVCPVDDGQILQRGERYGMIKFGSTTELYLPASTHPQVHVRKGQYVYGGETILAQTQPVHDPEVLAAAAERFPAPDPLAELESPGHPPLEEDLPAPGSEGEGEAEPEADEQDNHPTA